MGASIGSNSDSMGKGGSPVGSSMANTGFTPQPNQEAMAFQQRVRDGKGGEMTQPMNGGGYQQAQPNPEALAFQQRMQEGKGGGINQPMQQGNYGDNIPAFQRYNQRQPQQGMFGNQQSNISNNQFPQQRQPNSNYRQQQGLMGNGQYGSRC